MHSWLDELRNGMMSSEELARVTVRLIAAMIVGAIVGWNRERRGKAAGLRTHMLVSLGATMFVLACSSVGMPMTDISRVIQGVAAGIGFIGGGAILKSTPSREIHGMTTAASIWITAAAGVAIGMGRIGLGLLAAAISWLILSMLRRLDHLIDKTDSNFA